MTGAAKRKGDKAELEAAALLTDLLGIPVRRKLGAGRADDVGDLDGLPDTVVQVASWRDAARAVREEAPDDGNATNESGQSPAVTSVEQAEGVWDDDSPRPPDAASRNEMRRLFKLLPKGGMNDTDRHMWATAVLDREVTSWTQLSSGDVAVLCEKAEAGNVPVKMGGAG